MVRLGENLLKLVDLPFAYSLLSMLLLAGGTRLDLNTTSLTEIVPLVSLIGLLGTGLAIIDPFGRLIKWIVRRSKLIVPTRVTKRIPKEKLEKTIKEIENDIATLQPQHDELESIASGKKRDPKKSDDQQHREQRLAVEDLGRIGGKISDLISAKNTYVKELQSYDNMKKYETMAVGVEDSNWLSTEFEKTVAMCYFASILIAFIVALLTPSGWDFFSSYLASLSTLPNLGNVVLIIIAFSMIGLAAVIATIVWSVRRLIYRAGIVTLYQLATASNIEGKPMIRQIGEYLSVQDWSNADFVTGLLEYDLTGKVYRRIPAFGKEPLFLERK